MPRDIKKARKHQETELKGSNLDLIKICIDMYDTNMEMEIFGIVYMGLMRKPVKQSQSLNKKSLLIACLEMNQRDGIPLKFIILIQMLCEKYK